VNGWWTEAWSFGSGRSRMYCGISRTDEGYAVDVFSGDTCVDSVPCRTRADAARITQELKRAYQSGRARKAIAALAVPTAWGR